MPKQEPRAHHYAPQFYLRNFAIDADRRKIATVAKNGGVAVWSVRSIEGLGYERDFYVHLRHGAPVSVETTINRRIETPISASETWKKVTAGRADALDRTDRPVLYDLIRHLHARTPHARETMRELAEMAASPTSEIPFTSDERQMYAAIRSSSGGHSAYTNAMASSLHWAAEDFESCGIWVFRSPIRLKASTTPVLSIKAPADKALKLELPGMTPFCFILALDFHTLVMLAIGDFDGHFANSEMPIPTALHFNRQYVGQFAYFPKMRHLITGREGLTEAMTWAPYDFVEEDQRKVVFRRRPGQ